MKLKISNLLTQYQKSGINEYILSKVYIALRKE